MISTWAIVLDQDFYSKFSSELGLKLPSHYPNSVSKLDSANTWINH